MGDGADVNRDDHDLDLALASLTHTTVSGVTEDASRALATLTAWRGEAAVVDLLREALTGLHDPAHPLCEAGGHVAPEQHHSYWMGIGHEGIGTADDVANIGTSGDVDAPKVLWLQQEVGRCARCGATLARARLVGSPAAQVDLHTRWFALPRLHAAAQHWGAATEES